MKYKTERFQLAEVNQDLRKFATPNKDYLLSSKDFQKKYKPGVKVYEYIFRSLKPQIEDVQVSVNGVRIGSIKKGSVARVRKLLTDPKYSHSDIEIVGGRYQTFALDGNGNLKVQKLSECFYAHLNMYFKNQKWL